MIASVKLHAFHDIQFGLKTFGLFHRDDTLFAHFFHGFGDFIADFRLTIGRNRSHLSDFIGSGDIFLLALQIGNHFGNGNINAALEIHRIHARRDRLCSFAQNRLSQHRRRGGAIARQVGSLAGDFSQHLRPHVFKLIGQLNFFGDRNAILGDARRAE